jgi:hypothetical protein
MVELGIGVRSNVSWYLKIAAGQNLKALSISRKVPTNNYLVDNVVVVLSSPTLRSRQVVTYGTTKELCSFGIRRGKQVTWNE